MVWDRNRWRRPRAGNQRDHRATRLLRHARITVEALEERVLLSGEPVQLVRLDLDGAQAVDYRGPIHVRAVDVPMLRLPAELDGRETDVVVALISTLELSFAGLPVAFTTAADPSQPHSTVYIGGTDEPFGRERTYWGLAEKIDHQNHDRSDNAFVFSEIIAADYGTDSPNGWTVEGFAGALAKIVSHEVGHLIGMSHDDADHHHFDEVDPDPLAEVAYKPLTHVETAKDVRLDVATDGRVTIEGNEYEVHPKIVAAIRDYPGYYFAGSVGPDAFPDIVYGQGFIHPLDTGVWLTRIFDMAWNAQDDNSFSPAEKSQILAWSYGFATHAAGDFWAHNLVNEFSEGVFPSFFKIPSDVRLAANAVRHFIVEGYIGDATPGADTDDGRSLLPDGDMSPFATPGAPMEAPNRFIYDTLIKPFAGDPTITPETPNGARGFILDQFIRLQSQVNANALAAGPRPAESFDQLLLDAFNQLPNIPTELTEKLYRAYLYQWGDHIDRGLREWGSVGLAFARGLFEPQNTRDLENSACQQLGSDVDPARVDCEGSIGIVQRVLNELDDPNNDQRTDDSYINNHLLPMLGFPPQFGTLRAALGTVANLIDDNVIGPLRLALNPVLEPLDRIRDQAQELVVDWLTERFGLPPDTIDFLTNLPTKLDLASITLGSKVVSGAPVLGDANSDGIVDRHDIVIVTTNYGRTVGATFATGDFNADGQVGLADLNIVQQQQGQQGITSRVEPFVIPVMKRDDHEKVDRILGIQGIEQSEPLDPTFLQIPGVQFHEGARSFLNVNVEFDKETFSAYANAVTLAKILLLQETRVDGDFAAGQLSALMSDLLAETYDFSKLNVNGSHGGNILTATLPKPGELVTVTREDKEPFFERSDNRPWLLSIDTDHQWRQDSQTITTQKYRHHASGSASNLASWNFSGLPAGTYDVLASWFANITFTPATNASYRIFDGSAATPAAVFTIDQQLFADDVTRTDTIHGIVQETFYRILGSVPITSGTMRIELASSADGEVITGPIRIESSLPTFTPRTIVPARDEDGMYVQTPSSLYRETGGGWQDLTYATGGGNFPLWESDKLRPAFRMLFRDWQNGDELFPDLGDRPSPDPNQQPIFPDGRVGPFVSPFDPLPPTLLPTGADIIVTGNQLLTFPGDIVIGSIRGDGIGLPDSVTIRSPGRVTLSENVGGAGLLNLTIESGGGVLVANGITVSTRQVPNGADPRTANSVGDSGHIVVTSSDIRIGKGAALVGHGTGGFAGGNLSLTAADAKNLAWFLNIVGFQTAFGSATVEIGLDAMLTGNDIRVTTDSSTSKSATLDVDLAAGTVTELAQPISESEILDFTGNAAAVFSDTNSEILVLPGAIIRASRDVLLNAEAQSSAIITTRGRFLGVTYGSSSPTARVKLANGARVEATRNVELTSLANNSLDVTTFVPGGGDVANVSFSYGRARSVSDTRVDAGASINAHNITLLADNINSVRNRGLSAGFPQSGTAGVGATVVLGTYGSDARTTVAGTIIATGDLTVRARSINTRDETGAFASVVNPTGNSTLLQAVQDFIGDISLTEEVGSQTIDPNGPLADLRLAGALATAQTDNKAVALIDDGALVSINGNGTIDSVAEDHFRSTAVASAGDAGTASVGGAISNSKVANQATSFVGYNSVVDVDGDLNVTSHARIPNPTAVFDPTINLTDIDSASGTARIGEEFGDANAVGSAVGSALSPLNAHLSNLLSDPNGMETSLVHAGGTVTPGAAVGVAGGVTRLEIYNQGASGIAAGARVNQADRFDPPRPEQDVRIEGIGTVEAAHIAGQNSVFNFGAGSTSAVGGFANLLFFDNHARAYIDDRAMVSAGQDLTLHSDTRNKLLSDVLGGTAGGDVSVDGAFSLVRFQNESLAYIEDRAQVDVANHLSVTADNQLLSVNVAGANSAGTNLGVGAAAALTLVDNVTQAFVGDSLKPVGPTGTGGFVGGVRSSGDIDISADSGLEIWTVARSGASSSGPRGTGGLEESQALQFGFGVSGDVAFNLVRDESSAFVRDIGVSSGGALRITASGDPFVAASAGAVAFGNHSGIGGSFAHNGLTRITEAFAQEGRFRVGNLDITANADERLLTFSSGGSGAAAGAAVAGSANANRLSRATRAFLDQGADVIATGTVRIRADDDSDLVSAAGSASATANGFLAVGAAIELGFIRDDVQSFVGNNTHVVAVGDLQSNAVADTDVLSIAASMAEANGVGEATRLYRNSGTIGNDFANGTSVSGQGDLTQSVVLADLDGDNDLDLVTGNFAQFNRRFLNDGTGTFDAGETIGTDPSLAAEQDVELSRDQVFNALVPDLTTSLVVGDIDGDGDNDIISGNLGQPKRLYLNDGLGNFLPGSNIGSQLVAMSIPTSVTADNVTVADLITDLQQAIDAHLLLVGMQPGDIDVSLNLLGSVVLLGDQRVLEQRDSFDASSRIESARRDGILVTDSANSALTLDLRYNGRSLTIFLHPEDTLDNATARSLVGDIQSAINQALNDDNAGGPGSIVAQLGRNGRIEFVLGTHTLGESTSAENTVAAARSGFRLIPSVPGQPVTFVLTYDGSDLRIDVDPATTATNATINDLIADIQLAVDRVLLDSGAGTSDDIVVQANSGGRIVFALATHTLDDPTAAEDLLASSRRAGWLQAENDLLRFQFTVTDLDPTTSLVLEDLDGDGDQDLIAGNVGRPNRVYQNRGAGKFLAGRDIGAEIGFTTSLALGDLDGDGDKDLVAGNAGLNLTPMIDQGLLRLQNLVDGAVVRIGDLLVQTSLTLIDLARARLIEQFDFNALSIESIGAMISSGLTQLDDLARIGLLVVESFVNVSLPSAELAAAGIVTTAELLGLTDANGNVSVQDLVASGRVFLEELIREGFLGLSDITVSGIRLGDLFEQGFDLQSLIESGIAAVTDLVRQTLDVRQLVESGLISLRDLVQANLLATTDVDVSTLDVAGLLRNLSVGAATKIFPGNGDGTFGPSIELDTTLFNTRSVAIGNIDGDNDLDIILGNNNSPNRLYRNAGIPQRFIFSSANITNDSNETRATVLSDIDGDLDLDLIVGNSGQANRLYRNTGGTFAAGVNISGDANFTSSITVGDVTGDGRRDVIAGNAKPRIGVAGSGSALIAEHDVSASIADLAVVTVGSNVTVDALDQSNLGMLAGAAASGSTAGVGLSAAASQQRRHVSASIGDAEISARGAIATPEGIRGVLVRATANENRLFFAAGRAQAGDLGLAASIIFNQIETTTSAEIGAGATIRAIGNAVVAPSVQVLALHNLISLGSAGSFAGATQAGIGAAADIELLDRRVSALVADGANVTTTKDVIVDAQSTESLVATVAGESLGGTLSVAGSLAFFKLNSSTEAHLDVVRIVADGNVVVNSRSDASILPIAGSSAIDRQIGIGVSVAVVVRDEVTNAWVAMGANIKSRGVRGTFAAFTGQEDASGIELTRPVRGLIVSSLSDETILPSASGGAQAGVDGGAGSATIIIANDITRAWIDASANVNQFAPGETAANINQSVIVLADDDTTITGIAGTSVSTNGLGIGAGADVALIVKETAAFIAGRVDAANDVDVQAISSENQSSLANTEQILSESVFAAAGSLFALNIVTRASISDGARVRATGNVIVASDDETELDLQAGTTTDGRRRSRGAAAGGMVVEKITEASIGHAANVTALGARIAFPASTGDFAISFAAAVDRNDEVANRLTAVGTTLGAVFSNPALTRANEVMQSTVGFPLTIDAATVDVSLTQQRTATPLKRSTSGVIVTAISRDDIEAIAVGQAMANRAAELSALGVVVANRTSAFVSSDATVNASNSGAGANQSVHVAAGSDESVYVLSGTDSRGLLGSAGGSAGLILMDNITEAFVGESTTINVRGDVAVVSHAREDILAVTAATSVAIGFTLAPSFPVISLNSQSHARIDSHAVIAADGNVSVLARDDTDTDIVSGSAALQLGVGAGVSAGVTLIDKDTSASIGDSANVNARGISSTTTDVLDGAVGPTGFAMESIHGVAVQARSTEDVFTFVASGSAGLASIAGALAAVLVDSDTSARIDADARVNNNAAGVGALQSVNVSSSNDVRLHGGALNVTATLGALAGGVDVGIVRNDTTATIGENADVRGALDIEVHALSRQNVDSFVGGLGATGGVGILGAFSIYSLRSNFNQEYFGIRPLEFLNTTNAADSVQHFLDDQIFRTTRAAGQGVAGLLGNYADVIGGANTISTAIEAASPASALGGAIAGTQLGPGNRASVSGAQLTSGRHVQVTASERVDADLNSSFTFNFALGPISVTAYATDRGILDTSGSAIAGIDANAVVNAGGDVTVRSDVDHDQSILASTVTSATRHQVLAEIRGARVTAGGNVFVTTANQSDAVSAGILPGFVTTTSKSAEHLANSGVEAHISQSATVVGDAIQVTATDGGAIHTLAIGTTFVEAGTFGVLPAQGRGEATTEISNGVSALIDASNVTATAGDVNVAALSSPNSQAIAIGVAQASNTTIGGSVVHQTITSGITARVDGGAVVDAVGTVSLVATDAAQLSSIAGAVAALSPKAIGAAFATNDVNPVVSTSINDAAVSSSAGDVEMASLSLGEIAALTVGAAQANELTAGGSVSINNIAGVMESRTTNRATVTAFDDVTLSVTGAPTIRALAGGAAGSLGRIGVGAAVARNNITSQNRVGIDNATVRGTTGDVAIGVNSRPIIRALAAGAAAAADFGFAGSVTINTIAGMSRVSLENSANVDAGATLQITALDDSSIDALAGSIAGAVNTVAVAGSVARNTIHNIIEAVVLSNSTADSGSFVMTATDDADIRTIAGGGSISGALSASAGVADNDIANQIMALVTGAEVTVAGGMTLAAMESATIEGIAAGVSISGSLSVTGGVMTNLIANIVTASIDGDAVVSATGNTSVTARDESTIRALSGQIAGSGAVGIGAAASYNKISNTVRAAIEGATLSSSNGSLNLLGTGAATIETISASGSVGAAGVGAAGSVTVNLLDNTIEGLIRDATITVEHNVSILADVDNTIKVYAGTLGVGVAGFGGSAVVNNIENDTRALVENATVVARGNGGTSNVPQFNRETGVETSQAMRGLSVVATATENVDVRAMTAAGGAFALSGNTSVNNIADITAATLRGATVNTSADFGEQVVVRAHQSTDVDLFGGGAAVGIAAFGAAVDTTFVRNSTTAQIINGTSNSVVRARGIDIGTVTRETVTPIVTGIAISGAVAAAGAVSVTEIDSDNNALVEQSDLFSQGVLSVIADNTATINLSAGTAGAGLFVGAGGSVGVQSIKNTTRARSVGGHLNAATGTTIEADTDESVTGTAGTASAGLGAGLAGAVLVNTIETTTEASTSSIGGRHTEINQDPAFRPGGSFGVGSTQLVRIEADDVAVLGDRAGVVGLGAAGAGAAIDVGAIRNRTIAQVGLNTDVFAAGDVSLLAFSNREATSAAVAGGLGLVGLSGGISSLSLGAPVTAEGSAEFTNSLRTQVNNDIRIDTPALRGSDSGVAQEALTKVAGLTQPTVSSSLNTGLNTTLVLTAAFVENTTSAATAAEIVAGDDITISASNQYDVDISAGQVALGAVGLGAATGSATVANRTQAFLGNFGILEAVGDIVITAADRKDNSLENVVGGGQVPDESRVDVFAGRAGIIAAGGAKGKIDIVPSVDAFVGSNSVVRRASSLAVTTDHQADANVDGHGFSGAVGSLGQVSTSAQVRGSVDAQVLTNAGLGSTADIGSIIVQADSDAVATASTTGSTVGLASSGKNDSVGRVTTAIEASVGDGSDLNVSGDVLIRSFSSGTVDAETRSVTVSGLTLGLAEAIADFRPTLNSFFGSATLARANNVTVEAIHDGNLADARAEAPAGGVISNNGAESIATAAATVNAIIEDGADVSIRGALVVRSVADNRSQAASDGFTLGILVGIGGVEADATASGVTRAHVDGLLRADSLRVEAVGINIADAISEASGGGIVSGNSADSRAVVAPTIEAYIDAGGNVTTGGNVIIRSDLSSDLDSTVNGASGGGIDIGSTFSDLLFDPTVDASIRTSAQVHAGGLVTVSTRSGKSLDIENGLFNGTTAVDIGSNRITFDELHRLSTGDTIVYENNNNLNIGGLSDGRQYRVIPFGELGIQLGVPFVAEQIDSPTDTLRFPYRHHLLTGDRVVYTGFSNPVITGLSEGGSFFVRRIDDFTIKLTTTLAAAQAPLKSFAVPTAVNSATNEFSVTAHGFLANQAITYRAPAGTAAIAGLVDGRTYYVVLLDGNRFQLASIPSGPVIDIDASATSGTHQVGVEGLELSPSIGDHNLVIDLTSTAAGTHRMIGIAGAQGLVVPPTTDVSTASAKGSSGAFVGVIRTQATATFVPTVTAAVRDGVVLHATSHVNIVSLSDFDAATVANNKSGAFVSVGQGNALLTVNNLNTAQIGASAQITTEGTFNLQADSTEAASAFADTIGGGAIQVAQGDATTRLDHTTTTRFQAGARVTSTQGILARATTDLTATATARAGGAGFAASGAANDDRGAATKQGILIGTSADNSITQTVVETGVQLTGRSVFLDAQMVDLTATADSDADSDGVVADPDAVSRIEVFDVAQTLVQGTAQIRGTDAIDLAARHSGPDAISRADSQSFSGGSDADALAVNLLNTTTRIDADPAAILTTFDLDVRIQTTGGTFTTRASKDGGLIDFGSEHLDAVRTMTREIQFDADVNVLSGPAPALIVNDAGVVVLASNLTVSETATRVIVNPIVNNFTSNGIATRVDFDISAIAGQPAGRIRGLQSAITFRDGFESVRLTNHSSKELELNNIDVINRSFRPEVRIDVESIDGLGGIPGFAFDVAHSFGPTTVEAHNLDNRSAPDIIVDGVIENPIGTTSIETVRGDLVRGNATAVIRSQSVELLSPNGSIGTTAARMNVDLVRSAGRLTGLNAVAGTDIVLNLEGHLRDTTAGTFDIDITELNAGRDINVVLLPTVREIALPVLSYRIDVDEPNVPRVTEVRQHFRPLNPNPDFPLDLGAFGITTTNFDIPYTFGGTIAGRNLTIQGSGTTVVRAAGTVGVSGDGTIGLTSLAGQALTVAGGTGDNTITLSSSSGSMTIGGGAGTDRLTLTNVSGSIAASEQLTLVGSVTTSTAGATSISGQLILSASTIFDIGDSAVALDTVISATITGIGGLTKRGPGTLQLTGNNSYTGASRVEVSNLFVSGAQGNNDVSLAGGTLGGTGSVDRVVNVAGVASTISPGVNGPGRLSVTGGLTLLTDVTFVMQINGTTAGTQHDQIDVTGVVALSNNPLQVTMGFSSVVGNIYTIVRNDSTDAIAGTFAGLAQNATFLVGATRFRINYVGGDGNDITLTHVSSLGLGPVPVAAAVEESMAFDESSRNVGDSRLAALDASLALWRQLDATLARRRSPSQCYPTAQGMRLASHSGRATGRISDDDVVHTHALRDFVDQELEDEANNSW